MHQNMSLGSNGGGPVCSSQKLSMRLRGTNFCSSSARFAPSFKSQQNGPKCTKIVRTHKNMSLGSNGVDRVRSLRKIPTRLRGTNFCTSSARFCTKFCMATKRSKMHQNCTKRTKTSVLGLMGWFGCVYCEKFRRDFAARTLALVRPVLHRVS